MTWVVTRTEARAVTNMSSEIAHIESPCVGVCRLNAKGLCIGCLRTGEEIAAWMTLNEQERFELLNLLKERLAD